MVLEFALWLTVEQAQVKHIQSKEKILESNKALFQEPLETYLDNKFNVRKIGIVL